MLVRWTVYRGIDTVSGQMNRGHLLVITTDPKTRKPRVKIVWYNGIEYVVTAEIEPDTVGRATGFYAGSDRVFEDDYVIFDSGDGTPHVVFWDAERHQWAIRSEWASEKVYPLEDHLHEIRVVGNIHETITEEVEWGDDYDY